MNLQFMKRVKSEKNTYQEEKMSLINTIRNIRSIYVEKIAFEP